MFVKAPLFYASLLGRICTSQALVSRASQSNSPSASLLYEFPKGPIGWLENIAVRSNGQLVLTSIGVPGNLHVLDPLRSRPTPQPITGFEYTDTLGIVEAEHDVFYVVASNFSTTTVTVEPGTNTIWRVDFNAENPEPIKVATVGDANFLNGLTKLNNRILLAADSALGVVFAIDATTSRSWVFADDPLMKPLQGQAYVEGINGLHFSPLDNSDCRKLCFTNSQQYIFACIDVDTTHGRVNGPAEVVARPRAEKGFTAINWDDFAFDAQGVAYAATEKGNSVQAITPAGHAHVVAGDLNSTEIATPTSTAFGRSARDAYMLYAVTAGGIAFPVIEDGRPHRTGAQIVAINLRTH